MSGDMKAKREAFERWKENPHRIAAVSTIYTDTFEGGYDAGRADATEALLGALDGVLQRHGHYFDRGKGCWCGLELENWSEWKEHIVQVLREATT